MATPSSNATFESWQLLTWNPDRLFYLFCLVHGVIWTLLPALLYHSPPHDSLEGITWGNMWLWGYDKHPFLAPWLSAFVTDLFGVVGWPIYLLDQISVVVCFWAVWQVAKRMLEPWPAFIAVALLEGAHYYHFSAIPFNPNVAMLPGWALTSLAAYQSMKDQRLRSWVLFGFAAGLSMLAKYETAILLLCLLAVMVSTPEGRASFRKPGLYLGILTGFLVLSPHLLWLVQNDFGPFHYALGNMRLSGGGHPAIGTPVERHLTKPLMFVFDQMQAVAPILLLYLPFLRLNSRGWTTTRFNRVFILWLAFGPMAITLAIAFITGARLIPRWAFPFFSFVGLALVLYYRPLVTKRRVTVFLSVIFGLTVIVGSVMSWMILIRPHHTGKPPYSITYPSPELALWVTDEWHRRYGGSLKYVAGDRYVISAICAFSADKPVPYFDWIPRENPWLTEADLLREGAVMIHEEKPGAQNEALYAQIRKRFPGIVETRIAFPHYSKAKLPPVEIWAAFLPPQPRRSD